MDNIKQFLDFKLLDTTKVDISLYHIVFFLILILVTSIVIRILRRIFLKKRLVKTLKANQSYVIYQVLKYFIITIALVVGLNSMGLDLTLLLAGSAALFVGIGLGLQEVFKDIISGFILLFGQNIKIGDVIEFNQMVGKVTEIGFRVSKIITRDDIDMIIPNSRFTNGDIINWSSNNELTRFHLNIGVAYGSDVKKVSRILYELAEQHDGIAKDPKPFVRFTNFGESSLDFELLFWSTKTFRIENIKSDLRYSIDDAFRKQGITIPFPQRDVHMKK